MGHLASMDFKGVASRRNGPTTLCVAPAHFIHVDRRNLALARFVADGVFYQTAEDRIVAFAVQTRRFKYFRMDALGRSAPKFYGF